MKSNGTRAIFFNFAIFTLMTVLQFAGYGPAVDLQTSINIEDGIGKLTICDRLYRNLPCLYRSNCAGATYYTDVLLRYIRYSVWSDQGPILCRRKDFNFQIRRAPCNNL